ncbi:MAG: hypothetical protein HY842_19530 [Bacteroidetes bacterium]|nr:hypothetical protein [Bacteroidota bacterium]
MDGMVRRHGFTKVSSFELRLRCLTILSLRLGTIFTGKKKPRLRDFPDLFSLHEQQNPVSPLRLAVKVKTEKKLIVLMQVHLAF